MPLRGHDKLHHTPQSSARLLRQSRSSSTQHSGLAFDDTIILASQKTAAMTTRSRRSRVSSSDGTSHSTRTLLRTSSQPTMLDRGASSRSEWPWGFTQDLPSCEDSVLLERMGDIASLFQHECSKRAGVPLDDRARPAESSEIVVATKGHLVSKYNQRLQLYSVHAVVDVAGLFTDIVQDVLLAPDDAFLRRHVFHDDLLELHTLATIGIEVVDPTSCPPHEMQVPTACTLKKALFRERGMFLSHAKEILFLDYIHAVGPTAVLRVFKSVDNDNYPTLSRNQVVPRHTHLMGGFLVEKLLPSSTSSSSVDASHVRLTYYAEHAVYPKQFAASLDTRTRLEKFGSSMPSWASESASTGRRRPRADKSIAQTDGARDRQCRICDKAFHWFRRTNTCSLCGAAVCADCSTVQNVESPNGLRFKVPVCFLCLVQVRADDDGSAAHALIKSSGSAVPRAQLTLGNVPELNEDDGWSESSLGDLVVPQVSTKRLDTKKSILEHDLLAKTTTMTPLGRPCQLCTKAARAQCVVCGFYYCGQCADVDHANVVCYLCATKPPREPIVLLPPSDQALLAHGGVRASDESTPSGGGGHDFRDTYASTVPSSLVLQDSSFSSSVEDMMATYPQRRSVAPNLRFSADDDDVSSLGRLTLTEKGDDDDRSTPRRSPPAAAASSSVSHDGGSKTSSASSAAASSPPLVHVSLADAEAACLDMASNAAHDALCDRTAVDMECVNAYVVLLYKDQFMLKGAAGKGYIPASIPGTCAFCIHTVASAATDPLIVPDATVDPRFQDSVRVQGKERIRFYYGLPLRTTDGNVLGTVCVVDATPRMRISRHQTHLMERFARDVLHLIDQGRAANTSQSSK
ncbi:Aste57867_25334 [Aphanomyces stellatus]|uniref:Aste57867_25334 protein n=1 Tax=Aphanomyces stellatus TaxID=120398 RepID=A0A485LT01_9STRA|nr:hypothetical protein As57867_025256 [Aphanomyces stellatus]VFU01959.1 Aste57867_25334 [Aphanomyces stellatus]